MEIKFLGYDRKYLPELIRIHKESFHDHFNSEMSDLYTKKFLEWFAAKNDFDSIFMIAVDSESDSLIGYMCGALDGFYTEITRYLVPYTIMTFLVKPYLLFNPRIKELIQPKLNSLMGRTEYPQTKEFEETIPHPIFSVTAFAINDKYRKGGFGYFLLDRFFKEFFNEVKIRGGKTVRATIRSFNSEMYNYYKFHKWIGAPTNDSRSTLRFYKYI
jgi:hypothetical protein